MLTFVLTIRHSCLAIYNMTNLPDPQGVNTPAVLSVAGGAV